VHSFVQTTRKRRNLNEFPRCTTVLVAVWYIECWTCDRQVPGSNLTRGYSASTPTQRVIPQGSVNEYQRKLGSTRTYFAMHLARIRGLTASAGVRLRANEAGDQRCPMGAVTVGKDSGCLPH